MEDAYVLQLSDRKFSDLYLCYCGYARCEPLHSFGPAVRSNYLIHYILDGKGSYRAGGRRYDLKAGQGFLIEPGTQIFYEADEKEPWTYLWIGFHGQRAEEYLKDAGLGGGQLIFFSGDPHAEKLYDCSIGPVSSGRQSVYVFLNPCQRSFASSGTEAWSRQSVYPKGAGLYSGQLRTFHTGKGYCIICVYQSKLSVYAVPGKCGKFAAGISERLPACPGGGFSGIDGTVHGGSCTILRVS